MCFLIFSLVTLLKNDPGKKDDELILLRQNQDPDEYF